MIPAITNRGALSCMVFEGKFQNPVFIEFMRLCRNNVQAAQKSGDGASRSKSQAVELVSCRHNLSIGAVHLPVLDHVRGFDSGAQPLLALQNGHSRTT